jgi:hypothetical protein
VIFICGSEVFAVDMAPVQEIIRVPEVVRVPLAPATLEGLANLRGKVLPIISLRGCSAFPSARTTTPRAPWSSTWASRSASSSIGSAAWWAWSRAASRTSAP